MGLKLLYKVNSTKRLKRASKVPILKKTYFRDKLCFIKNQ